MKLYSSYRNRINPLQEEAEEFEFKYVIISCAISKPA